VAVVRLEAALRELRSAVLLTCAVSLAACSTGGLLPQSHPISLAHTQHAELPANIDLSPANWPTLDWWKRFGDPQLDAFVARALADSPNIALARARVDQAHAATAFAGAALQPQSNANFSSSRQRFSAHGTTPQPVAGTWNFVTQATIGVQYEIDFWGRNREQLTAQLGRERAAQVDAAAARLILSTAVVQTYIALQNTDDELDIEQAQLGRQEHILNLLKLRAKAQLDSQVDFKQALSTIPVRRAAIAALQERQELLRHELETLQGMAAGSSAAFAKPSMSLPKKVQLPSSVPAELIGRRPDVIAQRWRVEAAGHDIEVAKARFYPNINLSAMIGLQSLGFEHLDEYGNRIAGIGPAISLPIFDGGRLRAGLALQNATYDAAVETYNSTVLTALRDVADQLSSMKWLQTRMQEESQAVKTAVEAADLVGQRHASGIASYLQVLVAEDAVLQRRRAFVDLQAHALSLDAALTRAIGGGLLDASAIAENTTSDAGSTTASNATLN
jgi:NodT family efflux transporter outer membrane factor (OMF) lipoprotein